MESYNTVTVDAISPHLINHGYGAHLIRKTRAPRRPCGSSRDGLEHEWRSRHQDSDADPYIRSVINTEENFLAICFSRGQAELWTQIHTFEMDMNFKKVHRKSSTAEREILFGARVGLEAQYLVLARAYMSSQNTAAYEALFRELFRCLDECGVSVQWQHIDQAGIHGLTLDQDAAAIKGLGYYLHSKAPNMDWVEHCKKLGVTRGEDSDIFKEMMCLTNALTPACFDAICESLKNGNRDMRDWVNHKQKDYISCGLSQAYSLLNDTAWHALGRDTNGVESLHEQSYRAGGRYLDLLSAVNTGEHVDRIQLTRHTNAVKLGVNPNYKERTAFTRMQRATQRKSRGGSRTGRTSDRPEATSSGVMRTRGVRRLRDTLSSETTPSSETLSAADRMRELVLMMAESTSEASSDQLELEALRLFRE
ncbi:hypothetical protein E4U39_007614, partial [Claviceps sp. Clav50 group G5]